MLFETLQKPRTILYSTLAILLVLIVACGSSTEPAAAPSGGSSEAPAAAAPAAAAPAGASQAAPDTSAAASTGSSAASPAATQAPSASAAISVSPTTVPRAAAAPAEPAMEPAGTLTIAVITLGTENWLYRLAQDQTVFNEVGETLLRSDVNTRLPIPNLVEEWDVSSDGSTITWSFRLRQGTQFGEDYGELTAHDVRYTVSEFFKPDTVNPGVPPWKAAIDDDINNFEIVDDYNFKMHSSRSVPDLIWGLTQSGNIENMQSKAFLEAVGDEGGSQKVIGTGPWLFADHSRGQSVTLEARKDHWRQPPGFDELVLTKVPEESTRIAMVRTKAADITDVSFRLFEEVKAAGLKTKSAQNTGHSFINMGGHWPGWPGNCDECPWWQWDKHGQDPDPGLKIRQAMTLAINRQAIVDKILLGEGQPSAAPMSWMPGEFPFNNPTWAVPAYDPERARELLAEGGYPDGFEIEIRIFPLGGRPYQPDLGEAVAGYWEDIGLDVKRTITEYRPTVRNEIEKRTHNFTYVFTTSFRDEPLMYLRILFTPKASVSHFEDPVVTDFVERLSAEPNLEQRMIMSREIGDWVVQNQMAIPLVSVNSLWALSDRVGEWQTIASQANFHNLELVTPAK